MKLKPQSDYLLCVLENTKDTSVQKNGIWQSVNIDDTIPEYKIVDMTIAAKLKTKLKIGDAILSNSIPTKAKIDGTTYFLVKAENVIGKICS